MAIAPIQLNSRVAKQNTYLDKEIIMVRVTVSNAVERQTIIVDESATIAEILEATGIAVSGSAFMVNGDMINDINVSLADLGVHESCSVSAVKHTQNA